MFLNEALTIYNVIASYTGLETYLRRLKEINPHNPLRSIH